ncbi:MAG: hypothetical protein O3C21_16710 [Verrucomicrobia bacterium]|nr:hypothetical protein [Verrucomicrobiota bacterium]
MAPLTRYGAVVRPPAQLKVDYRCDADGANVDFLDARYAAGELRDPHDVHPSTLHDAFNMHWSARQRLVGFGFEVFRDRAERVLNGLGCVLSKPLDSGIPRLTEPVCVSFLCSERNEPFAGVKLEFDQLSEFLDRLIFETSEQ